MAQPIRTSSSLFRRSQRVNRTRRLLSLVDSSSRAVKGAGSVSSRCEITLFPEKRGDGQAGWSVLEGPGRFRREKENLLVAAADECEPLGHKPKPVSTLYFCRPPRTRSKRTPARQQAEFPSEAAHSLVSCTEVEEQQELQRLPDSEDLPSLIIPACRHLRKRQAWHAFLRRLVISHAFITGQLYSMLPRETHNVERRLTLRPGSMEEWRTLARRRLETSTSRHENKTVIDSQSVRLSQLSSCPFSQKSIQVCLTPPPPLPTIITGGLTVQLADIDESN